MYFITLAGYNIYRMLDDHMTPLRNIVEALSSPTHLLVSYLHVLHGTTSELLYILINYFSV